MSARHLGRRLRLLAGATALTTALVVAMPAALAAYTGSYTPTQNITAPFLSMPSSFACSAPGNNSVSLTWLDTDGTTADPYASGTFVIAGYQVERQVNNGSWTSARDAVGRGYQRIGRWFVRHPVLG